MKTFNPDTNRNLTMQQEIKAAKITTDDNNITIVFTGKFARGWEKTLVIPVTTLAGIYGTTLAARNWYWLSIIPCRTPPVWNTSTDATSFRLDAAWNGSSWIEPTKDLSANTGVQVVCPIRMANTSATTMTHAEVFGGVYTYKAPFVTTWHNLGTHCPTPPNPPAWLEDTICSDYATIRSATAYGNVAPYHQCEMNIRMKLEGTFESTATRVKGEIATSGQTAPQIVQEMLLINSTSGEATEIDITGKVPIVDGKIKHRSYLTAGSTDDIDLDIYCLGFTLNR